MVKRIELISLLRVAGPCASMAENDNFNVCLYKSLDPSWKIRLLSVSPRLEFGKKWGGHLIRNRVVGRLYLINELYNSI